MYEGKIEAAPTIIVSDARTYLQWLAQSRGIDVPASATFTDEGIKQGGRIILAMPGYGQSNVVEVEELDEGGNVIRSSRIGLKSNGAMPWTQQRVRELVGPVAKPAKAHKSSPPPAVEITETPPAVEIGQDAQADLSPVQAQEPVTAPELPSIPDIVASVDGVAADAQPNGDWLALVDQVPTESPEASTAPADMPTGIAALVARMDAMEATIAALSHGDAHPAHENEQAGAANVLPGPWKGARGLKEQRAAFEVEQHQADRARRERIVRAYLRTRAERNSLRSHLSIGQAQYDDMKAARVAADRRAESLEFDMADLRDQLAKQTARADAAESLTIPALDKAQARITELEERLAAMPKPKVPFALAATMGRYVAPMAMQGVGR